MDRLPTMSEAPLAVRRDEIVAHLGAAWAAEAIGEQEMERRMSAAFAARERSDLDRLVADLPAPHALVPLSEPARGAAPRSVAPRGPQLASLRRVLLSSVDERVRGVVPPQLEFGARFSSIEMDFTEAVFANAVTEIVVDALFSSIELTFAAGTVIECDVHGALSNVEVKDRAPYAPPSGQTVRISGSAWFANVEVKVGRR